MTTALFMNRRHAIVPGVARKTLLERIIDERAGQTVVGTVSVAVERMAEEIARETLKDETFRRTLHELVRRRSQAILDRLLGNGERRIPPAVRRRRRTR